MGEGEDGRRREGEKARATSLSGYGRYLKGQEGLAGVDLRSPHFQKNRGGGMMDQYPPPVLGTPQYSPQTSHDLIISSRVFHWPPRPSLVRPPSVPLLFAVSSDSRTMKQAMVVKSHHLRGNLCLFSACESMKHHSARVQTHASPRYPRDLLSRNLLRRIPCILRPVCLDPSTCLQPGLLDSMRHIAA